MHVLVVSNDQLRYITKRIVSEVLRAERPGAGRKPREHFGYNSLNLSRWVMGFESDHLLVLGPGDRGTWVLERWRVCGADAFEAAI